MEAVTFSNLWLPWLRNSSGASLSRCDAWVTTLSTRPKSVGVMSYSPQSCCPLTEPSLESVGAVTQNGL